MLQIKLQSTYIPELKNLYEYLMIGIMGLKTSYAFMVRCEKFEMFNVSKLQALKICVVATEAQLHS